MAEVAGGGVAQIGLGRAEGLEGGVPVGGAAAHAQHERRAASGKLVHDERRQHLGVAHEHGAGDAGRRAQPATGAGA